MPNRPSLHERWLERQHSARIAREKAAGVPSAPWSETRVEILLWKQEVPVRSYTFLPWTRGDRHAPRPQYTYVVLADVAPGMVLATTDRFTSRLVSDIRRLGPAPIPWNRNWTRAMRKIATVERDRGVSDPMPGLFSEPIVRNAVMAVTLHVRSTSLYPQTVTTRSVVYNVGWDEAVASASDAAAVRSVMGS